MRVLRQLSCVLLAALVGVVQAAQHDPQKLAPIRVQDLQYGDVLFHYYQQDDFEALTRLLAYQHWNQVPHHELDSQLLLGGLYLSLGLYNEAGERFSTLLTPNVPQGVRNRAWFYLGQIWYARGYLDKAVDALRHVQGTLPEQQEAQKIHLLANALLRQGHFDEAIALLKSFNGPPDWLAFAQFNLGVALVRQQRMAEADTNLTAVGTLVTGQTELLALRDRANLALGFAYLQANQPAKARVPLERVRLNGAYSNKALLGLGWADAALGDFQAALSPWTELRHRSLLDSAVQESYLAVPYAYGKLESNAQAAQDYESALISFAAEQTALDGAIGRIRSGKMLDELLAGDEQAHYGWFWQLRNLPDEPESRYLYSIMAGHDFQEGLKNYRDLGFLGSTLDVWSDSTQAFGDMIETRERAYAQRLPQVDQLLASGAVDQLQHRRDDLEARLAVIDARQDVAALGSPEERAHWEQLRQIEDALGGAPHDEASDALRERLRLLKGVMFFQLTDAFKARQWQERRTLKDLDLALHEAQSRWIRVDRARRSVPTNTGEFAARLASLKTRITDLQARLGQAEQAQQGYLQQIAVAELSDQKDRLDTYEVQARFALATMYDKAASADAPQPVPAPGTTAPPPAAPGAPK
ncbi:MAG: tetratricopeptide repeat protein [Steroidobacteraceae bacterium]